MADSLPFADMLSGLRRGDDGVVTAFVRRYAPFIRRSIRLRLTRLGLRVFADSEDVCQSVLAGFLLRLATGEYDIANTDALERLLAGIARNKLAELARREVAQKRDHRRLSRPEDGGRIAADSDIDPVRVVAARDLLAAVRARLRADELPLFVGRQEGRSWEELAAQTGETAAAARQRLSRAMRRVAIELGLEGDDE